MAFEIDRVREIAERIASSSGLEVVEIELRGGGKARMLRVFLDKPAASPDLLVDPEADPKVGAPEHSSISGVTHEDCANFSREFGTILEVEDAAPNGSYTLEVSSPGLDRKLSRAKDFERFVGSRLKLMTRTPVNNNQHFEGRLESFQDGRLTLDTSAASKKSRKKMGAGEEKIQIDFANVEKANLVPEI